MRIDTLTIQNFKKFENVTVELHPQFNLFIGENGSGKTSVLDALAVALGIWLIKLPDSALQNSKRNILPGEVRIEPSKRGDRIQFIERKPVVIRAVGKLGYQENVKWTRYIEEFTTSTNSKKAMDAIRIIADLYHRANNGEDLVLPVIAYYGAGRAWLSSSESAKEGVSKSNGPARRWSAFQDCLKERIRVSDIQRWFQNETVTAVRKKRPGFEIVKHAILNCIPDADGIEFDTDRDQIVLSIAGKPQLYGNLSSGQKVMLALSADIAIKSVTQNAHLIPTDSLDFDELPAVLSHTPGVVLIDEIDVHLHPRWQRRVVADLKRTFPSIQFMCTSHSAQIIGETNPEEIRILEDFSTPGQSFGMDSNWILEVLMGADAQDADIKKQLDAIFKLIHEKELDKAEAAVISLKNQVGNSERLQRASSTLGRLRRVG
ncbi:MAG: AAA family ATPase [Armatimonadetes bacterium]|nr:AAA family ATPase [Armatimonadota bacterium]